jgi:ABC-type amino acid transport substrate-binding protein
MNLKAMCVLSSTAALLMHAPSIQAGPVIDRIKASGTIRVCIWPDYYGITHRSPRNPQLTGLDVDLSADFARRLGVKLEYVESSFPKLVDNLAGDRCDIAMHAVPITSQPKQALRFSKPYLQSDIYGVTTRAHRLLKSWADIDKAGMNVAVHAGTFMESVMGARLTRANLIVIRPPQTSEEELETGRIDVVMTDYAYSQRLLENADWARLIAPPQPFHRVFCAYAVKPGDDDWLRAVDEFLAEMKRDGRLEMAARRHGLDQIVVLQ